ncbi:hypothetical protein [Halosolutus halophilus]|uniref:hypothetical protein n=1 Tax=Halosolutus halophilus TaxID=1552990 RepID=UPI002234F784|nr:hypothetical protein [Halosolutus halophilus]
MAAHDAGRRRFLSGVTATLGIALVTGCLGSTDDGDEDTTEPVVDVAETTEGNTDPEVWADVESLQFDGWVGGWVGVEPEPIADVENPTLVLVEGREYEITWENMDGIHHNFAFWDADHDVVNEYSTPGTDVQGETETLTIEAMAEMETYRCEYQQARQRGDVVLLDSA